MLAPYDLLRFELRFVEVALKMVGSLLLLLHLNGWDFGHSCHLHQKYIYHWLQRFIPHLAHFVAVSSPCLCLLATVSEIDQRLTIVDNKLRHLGTAISSMLNDLAKPQHMKIGRAHV